MAIRHARSRGSRRSTAWALGLGGSTVSTQTTTSAGLLGAGVAINLGSVTIVRIRGMARVWLTTASALGEGFHGALGIGLVTTQAFNVGATAVPEPLGDMEWDGWMWHQFFDVFNGAATVADVGESFASEVNITIDSKAMRKFDEDMTLIAAFEAVEIGTATVNMALDSRLLVKLG